MRAMDIAKGWDSDLGLNYLPKAELFGVVCSAGMPVDTNVTSGRESDR